MERVRPAAEGTGQSDSIFTEATIDILAVCIHEGGQTHIPSFVKMKKKKKVTYSVRVGRGLGGGGRGGVRRECFIYFNIYR